VSESLSFVIKHQSQPLYAAESCCLNRRMVIPTPTGPTIVQRTTAQTITKKISSPEVCTSDPSRFFKVNVPELCDRDAIKKPISPLAIMANPTSKAIAWGAL